MTAAPTAFRAIKILCETMRGIADGHEEPVPSTTANAAALDTLWPVLAPSGSRQVSR
jgi:propionyl-CoA synthetase